MEFWINFIIAGHVLVALAIIGLVLLQQGKGADMGSGFGGGASGSLFGATGSANFLSRITAALATVFFLTSLGLAYVASTKPKEGGATVMDAVKGGENAPPKPAQDAGKAPTAADVPVPSAPVDGGQKAKDVPR